MEDQEQRTEVEEPKTEAREEKFDIVGVQVGMRRHVVRGLMATTISIGDKLIEGFRCEIVDPAPREEDPPDLLEVVIPESKVDMFIIHSEQIEEDESGTMGGGNMGDTPEDTVDNGKKSAEELERESEALVHTD